MSNHVMIYETVIAQVAVLVLVDKQLLPSNFWSTAWAPEREADKSYIGHYILLVRSMTCVCGLILFIVNVDVMWSIL